MDKTPDLFRKRYLPDELIFLKDDIILKQSDDLIITSWDTLKPRSDIKCGLSAYFLKEGYKISKVYNANDELVYWYCDIIDSVYDDEANSYTFHDLLVDITVDGCGFVKVLDLDEIGDLLEQGKITPAMCIRALRTADKLLRIIYNGDFYQLQKYIEEIEA